MRGMATTTVRCPNCGAKNKGGIFRCRVCSADLRADAEQPMTRPEVGTTTKQSASLSGVVGLAVAGIALLLVAALLLGVVSGPQWFTNAVNKVPFVNTAADDGWTRFVEEPAQWEAEMPVDRTKSTVGFPASTTGTADQWLTGLGGTSTLSDTELSIIWTTVPRPAGENIDAALASTAVLWGAALGGKVTENDEATFEGFPARRVTITDLKQGDEDATIEAVLIRRDEQLVVLVSRSVYPDHPQFSRLVENFSFV